MATSNLSSEIITKERKKLIEIIQRDPDSLLDELLGQGIITDEEYNVLNEIENITGRARKLLIHIQKKEETSCKKFLERLKVIFPDLTKDLQCSLNGSLTAEDSSKIPECHVSLKKGNLKNREGPMFSEVDDYENQEGPVFSEVVGPENKEDPVFREKVGTEERRQSLQDILRKLEMEKHRNQKLRLREILEIGPESLKERTHHRLGDLPWHFLRKLMALNGTARNTSLVCGKSHDPTSNQEEEDLDIDVNTLSHRDNNASNWINPLDVVCAILLCSDSFLQQEILSKMSMCQFALPLLLPPLDTPKCSLMLWALRDIVRKWRPHSLAESRGFREESLVLTPMPTITFVRLGSCSLSKSKLLNQVLSPSHQHHNFFIHRDMECGNIPQEISDGLVEISWYFPSGEERSDLFQEPLAVTNLRGDIESHRLQFRFLAEVSSAVFIFIESISVREYNLLSNIQGTAAKYYFILNNQAGKSGETMGFLSKLAPLLKLKKSQLLVKDRNINERGFVEILQGAIKSIVKSLPKEVSIVDMGVNARGLGIQVDEDCDECQTASKWAKALTDKIDDIVKYKGKMLRLQGDPWKELAKVEKEMCRMRQQADTPPEEYKSQLKTKWLKLRRQQSTRQLTDGLKTFLTGIRNLPLVEKHYFLKWMKFNLDHIARESLSKLRAEYKENSTASKGNPPRLAELDKLISASSLGVEHFMRELGQFYEAEYSMTEEGTIAKNQRQFNHLPGVAADLMLEGFPVELIDGDASNIPLRWVTDVLTELHAKLGKRSRMLVLTVLGVQSTGKSTLLNTMFGLQFAVSSGRCTRGAFMLLLKVTESFQQELGCDFILVIDTEGLKAPELAKLEDSYEHDNELATLVIGLSDITIVNIAMENATEMKDVLQIVVHAFLRMERSGMKPNCQFVHQNVCDVSAHEKNMRDRKHLLEQLNEMTKAAARMEKQSKGMTFSDIMKYDAEKHNWYIRGLWHGDPPMAPVNIGYSENVCELKTYLLEFIKINCHNRPPKDIPQFIKLLNDLWSAVKHENFIFSFRNCLVAEAYNQLSRKYSDWEWEFRKEMYQWTCKKENFIQNQTAENLNDHNFQYELQQKLSHLEKESLAHLEKYYKTEAENPRLIEKYREDFIKSTKGLRKELERDCVEKCEEAILIHKEQHKINNIKAEYKKIIEGKVDKLLSQSKRKKDKLDLQQLEAEFQKMWRETLAQLKPIHLERKQICEEMAFQLGKDLENRGPLIYQKFRHAESLLNYGNRPFQVKKEHIYQSHQKTLISWFLQENKSKDEVEALANSLISKCKDYIQGKVNARANYNVTNCRELLRIINKKIGEDQKPPFSPCFEVDLKLHLLGMAAHAFQKMHDDFTEKNDPKRCLEELKAQYFSIFRDLYEKKDNCQKWAWNFCEQCLKPALLDYVNKRLGIKIVDNFLSKGESIEYSSRIFFQFTVLKTLLEEMNFDNYMEYIKNYESFVKTWIQRRLLDHYSQTEDLVALETEILSTIINKVKAVLQNTKNRISTVDDFLDNLCQELQQDLVISKDLTGIKWINTANTDKFSDYIQNSLSGLEENILDEFKKVKTESKFSSLQLKPQDTFFNRVFGCGKLCPFCKEPCEARGKNHKEHTASIHRSQGIGGVHFIPKKWCVDGTPQQINYGHEHSLDEKGGPLICTICTTSVNSNEEFYCPEKAWKLHPYRDYRDFYPDWQIPGDSSINASDYWKFVLKEFNDKFAARYNCEPAGLPDDWRKITKQQALNSIKEAFNMK
uniref:VLIG-type G domain-containing protein n=1 Tax=Sphenodon punctatus TaxID=8508 RepID=A0A8D0HHL8_SPHPU